MTILNMAWGWGWWYDWPYQYSDYSAMRWPCSPWFHIPLLSEWQWVKTIMDWLGITASWNVWKAKLHLPLAWYRNSYTSNTWGQWDSAYYWTCTNYSGSAARIYQLSMDTSTVNPNNYNYNEIWGNIRWFKDLFIVPTPIWTVIHWTLWGAWIFWNQTDWIISITSNWLTWYTISDKNVWATTVYNDWDTLAEDNCGKYFQWWNNYWFPFTGSVTTSNDRIDASSYWPTNPYSCNIFRIWASYWMDPVNNDIRWWVTWVQQNGWEYVLIDGIDYSHPH